MSRVAATSLLALACASPPSDDAAYVVPVVVPTSSPRDLCDEDANANAQQRTTGA